MKLRELEISNFKSIYNLKTKFNDLTILIGRNDSGKTAILEAIQLLFGILRSVKESINLTQIIDPDIKDQIRSLWFYNNWDKPIEIRAAIEFDTERSLNEVKEVIENECGLKEELQGLDCTITIQRKDNIVELAVKELNILGCATLLKKEILKNDREGKPTACKVIENYNVLNSSVMEAIRKLLEDKIKIIIPATVSTKEKLRTLGSLAYALRTPVISEELIENIKDAKSDYSCQRLFFSLTQRIEGAESFFERPQERDILSKLYNYGTGYTSLPFPSYGSGSQTVDAIIASIVTAKPGSIILIEEPETHQHPTFVKRLARVIETLPKRLNVQIILTTHSPIFVSAIRLKESIITVRKEYIDTSLGKVPATRITRAGEIDFRKLDIIVSELGVPVSLPFFADVVILVEGGSDKIILEHMIELLWEEGRLRYLPMFHYEIVPFAQTPGGIDAWIDMLTRYGIKAFVIVDNDEEGRRYKDKAERRGLRYGENVFILEKEDILCYIPGEYLSKLVEGVLNELFNAKDRLGNESKLLDKLNQLYEKMKSGESCKSALDDIASIVFDNVLDENEKEFYKNKNLLERLIKMEVAKKAIYHYVFREVPEDIAMILQAIDRGVEVTP